MINAGIATGKQSGTCVLTDVNSNVFAHPLRFAVRFDERSLSAMGHYLVSTINQLFGGNAATMVFTRASSSVVSAQPTNPPTANDNWDAYTYGYSVPTPYFPVPNHMYPTYDSLL